MKLNTLKFLLLVSAFCYSLHGQGRLFKTGKIESKNFFETIPLEFQKNKIYIGVEIEGKTYRFLVDTGAPNIISKELSEAIHTSNPEDITTSDANNLTQELDVVRINEFKIGKVIFSNFTALVFDFQGSDIFKCLEIDGFIGSNALRDLIIQFDVHKKELTLTDKIKELNLNKKNSQKIKLVNDQASPYIWVDLEGKETGREFLLIDTGMGELYDPAKVNYETFSEYSIFNEIGNSVGASSISLFGEVPENRQVRVHLPKLKINEFEIQNIITHTSNDTNSKIGAELLEHGIMTIDFKHKRFYFDPLENNIDVNGDFGMTQTIKDNKIVVGYVWDETLKNSLSYGDTILEINGLTLSDTSICEYITLTSLTREQKTMSLKVKDKEGKMTNLILNKRDFSDIWQDFTTN